MKPRPNQRNLHPKTIKTKDINQTTNLILYFYQNDKNSLIFYTLFYRSNKSNKFNHFNVGDDFLNKIY